VIRCVTLLTHKVALMNLASDVGLIMMDGIARMNWPPRLDSGNDARVENAALVESA